MFKSKNVMHYIYQISLLNNLFDHFDYDNFYVNHFDVDHFGVDHIVFYNFDLNTFNKFTHFKFDRFDLNHLNFEFYLFPLDHFLIEKINKLKQIS